MPPGPPFRASIRSAAAAGSAAGRWSKQQDHNHGHHLTEALLDFLDHPADREDSEEGVAQPERQRCRAGTWAVRFRLGIRLASVARRIAIHLLKTSDAAVLDGAVQLAWACADDVEPSCPRAVDSTGVPPCC